MRKKEKHNQETTSESLNVSVVVCTKNAANTIVECLESVAENNPKEVILVDAHSDDKTQQLAEPYVTKIVEDPGLGLAIARNIGIDHAKGNYISYVGADNVIPKGTLKNCIDYLNENNHVGVSTQTVIKDADSSYLSYAMNLYKKARFQPGCRTVIGTPHLFITDVLKKHKFDDKMTWSDDSDLCFRLSKLNYTFGIADTFVYEIGMENIASIITRWKNYGRSDFEYYMKYSKDWKIKRKILSILHPLRSEFAHPLFSKRLEIKEKIQIIPFLMVITMLRYIYWIKYTITNKTSSRGIP